jgi:hypothetical protein
MSTTKPNDNNGSRTGWTTPRPYRGYPWIEITFLLVIVAVAWVVWAIWGGH